MKPDVNLNLIRCGVLGMAILLGGALIATPAEAVAQTSSTAQPAAGSINGTVVDSEGEPVIGATVMVKGTTIGTATDIDGQFHIKAAPGQEVIIKGFGYETATIKVTSQKDYSVTLKLAAQSLDDVVVIGYGT